jgi:hypothetical protein
MQSHILLGTIIPVPSCVTRVPYHKNRKVAVKEVAIGGQGQSHMVNQIFRSSCSILPQSVSSSATFRPVLE